MTATENVYVFDADPARAAKIAALLAKNQPPSGHRSVSIFQDLKGTGQAHSLGGSPDRRPIPGVAVIVEGNGATSGFADIGEVVRRQGVPTLGIVDVGGEPRELAGRVRDFDDWMTLDSLEKELPIRVAALLDPGGRPVAPKTRLPTIDPRFLSVVIHDLRTPLNVIMLTIRAITQTVPDRSAELDEDLTFLKENAWQIEKMLLQLVDYGRLIEGEARNSASEFNPRRFLSDFIEVYRSKAGAKASQVHLEIAETSPDEVSVDQARALLALQQSLTNAMNAAGSTPVRLRSSGGPGRWIIELIVDKPPPDKMESIALRPEVFERLEGSAGERRGLDLAIASRVSELFGGSARLIAEPGRRTIILLDWPERLENG